MDADMNLGIIARVGFVIVALALVYAFGLTVRDAELRRVCTPSCAMHPTYRADNRLAPDFDIPDINGGRLRLSDYRGKVVILNFWTKSCAPCLQEMPDLSRLAAMLKDEGHDDIVFLTVSQDESPEDIRNTLQSVLGGQANFPVGVDPEGAVIADRYGTKLFPETWFIDPDGVIRARIDGARSNWGTPLVVDFARSFTEPLLCPIRFADGVPQGDDAGLCKDVTPTG